MSQSLRVSYFLLNYLNPKLGPSAPRSLVGVGVEAEQRELCARGTRTSMFPTGEDQMLRTGVRYAVSTRAAARRGPAGDFSPQILPPKGLVASSKVLSVPKPSTCDQPTSACRLI